MTGKFHRDAGDLVKRARSHQNPASINPDQSHEEYARGEIIRNLADCIEVLEAAITVLECEAKLAERVVKAVRHIPRYNRHGELNDAIDAYDDFISQPRPTPSPGLDPTLPNDAYDKETDA